ncbi:protein CLN8-like [Littorina saxatilis]|uniref:TLC domain-containing protein n=1 Tax=Littorina saxatilis TaxID=31220 RepID=A0AAN9FZX4_9CAEN
MSAKANFELVEAFHPTLAKLDYTQTSVKFKLIGASVLVWASIYTLSAILASFVSTYSRLKVKEKVFWNLAVVRASFGFFCTAVGSWAIFTQTAMDKDVVFGTTPTSYFSLCITVGFFLFECSALTISDVIFKSFSFLLNLHHWLSLVGYCLVIYTGAAHCFACKGLILEMSTPLSALCWTLLKAGKERSFVWKANQFLLVHTFHLRSVVECMFWYITYHNWNTIWGTMPMSVFLALYVQLTLVSLVMTPYWTYKKTVQMINPVDWNFEKTVNAANHPQTSLNGSAATELKKSA